MKQEGGSGEGRGERGELVRLSQNYLNCIVRTVVAPESQYMHTSNCRLFRPSTFCTVKRQYSHPLSTMASTFPPPAVREMACEVSTLLKERSQTVCVAETVRSASLASPLPLLRDTMNR